MRNTSGVRTSKLGLSKILIGFVFILYCLGRCRRKTGIPDPEVRVLGGQNDLTREFFFLPLSFLLAGDNHTFSTCLLEKIKKVTGE